MTNYKKFLFGILCIILFSISLFAEQNWWEEDDFSYTQDKTKYEQIFSTRNDNKIMEAKIIALMKEKMNGYLKNSSHCAYEWMIYDESYKQQNKWELRIMKLSKPNFTGYDIWFYFSNGVFLLRFADDRFLSTVFEIGASAKPINTDTEDNIVNALLDCQLSSRKMWIKHGLKPKGFFPMKFMVE